MRNGHIPMRRDVHLNLGGLHTQATQFDEAGAFLTRPFAQPMPAAASGLLDWTSELSCGVSEETTPSDEQFV